MQQHPAYTMMHHHHQEEEEDDEVAHVHNEDEIDLDGYEAYVAEMQETKATRAQRPLSARSNHHHHRTVTMVPDESPQFYLVHHTASSSQQKPTRPMSARARLNHSTPHPPKAPSSGMRRKRPPPPHGVNARIRAVYHDVGRSKQPQEPTVSVTATNAIANRLQVFQQAELHDEYYRLVDVVTELRAAVQQEQVKRVRAIARVRRLEEIVSMKDKKIESLLQTRALSTSGVSTTASVLTDGTMAPPKDRQYHTMLQRLRHKITTQSHLLSSYEEAMQSLRAGIKSTNLMELETEREQLYVEIRAHERTMSCQTMEIETLRRQVSELTALEANYNQHMARAHQEHKKSALEKQKLEQEIGFLKSRVDQLQTKLTHEQRKRAYDREITSNHQSNNMASPSRSSVLVAALEEMKTMIKKERSSSSSSTSTPRSKGGSGSTPPSSVSKKPTTHRPSSAASLSRVTPSIASPVQETRTMNEELLEDELSTERRIDQQEDNVLDEQLMTVREQQEVPVLQPVEPVVLMPTQRSQRNVTIEDEDTPEQTTTQPRVQSTGNNSRKDEKLSEEASWQQLEDAKRLLREVEALDTMDSDSSDDFLHDAELQLQQEDTQNDSKEEEEDEEPSPAVVSNSSPSASSHSSSVSSLGAPRVIASSDDQEKEDEEEDPLTGKYESDFTDTS